MLGLAASTPTVQIVDSEGEGRTDRIIKSRAAGKTTHKTVWKRRPEGTRGKLYGIQFYAALKPAADPVPMTRQVRRQNERRAVKMPLKMSQKKWHQMNGFGKSA